MLSKIYAFCFEYEYEFFVFILLGLTVDQSAMYKENRRP